MGLDQSIKVYSALTSDGQSTVALHRSVVTLDNDYRQVSKDFEDGKLTEDEANSLFDEIREQANKIEAVLETALKGEWVGRKENHIQNYFEERYEVKNCEQRSFPRLALEELSQKCFTIWGLWRDGDEEAAKREAERSLPTTAGFFYGSTDYDEWYFDDLKREADAFTELLEKSNDEDLFVYWCWW